jgi:membrane associated rhomboid family serine protease
MIPIRDTIPSRNPSIAIVALIIMNSVIFALELMMPEHQLDAVIHLFGLIPARYTHPEWAMMLGFPVDDYWPFFTSMFLHGGWLHIIGNMWTLWIFGDNVEDRMGPVRFLIFYLLCGLIGGIVHWFTNANSTIPAIGASGAIAGVLGAYFVLYPKARIIAMIPILFFPFFFEISAFVYLGIWILSQILSGTISLSQPVATGGIAFWGHIGGFMAGLLLHPLFIRRERSMRPDEWALEGAWHPFKKRERWSW